MKKETPDTRPEKAQPVSNGASKRLSTDPYKGVRDFYPDAMAVQQYIFDTWSYTAESFGYERYDASVLEPSDLYTSKGATSAEIVNDQTYTFTDRGDRSVTLRPEMTPTAARMIAGRRRELSFPVRWYAIPNLFRYERSQRGRLREHWQFNCDIFGTTDLSADVEAIALAYQTLINFGADESMFEIRINNRAELNAILADAGLTDEEAAAYIRLLDRKDKIDNFDDEAAAISPKTSAVDFSAPRAGSDIERVMADLAALGIDNVVFSPSTVRGFDYYTGTVFELFDTDPENKRALAGGGRYDNLTESFGGDAIPGIGFGMGDVTMRDFLETHNILTADITAPSLMIIPTDTSLNIDGQQIAQEFRGRGVRVAVDISEKKTGKKIAAAGDALVSYALVFGSDELASNVYTVKNLTTGEEISGTLQELSVQIANLSA